MHGVDVDRLEKACRLLGDTVLDPAIWPLAMDEICRAVAASGAMLLPAFHTTPVRSWLTGPTGRVRSTRTVSSGRTRPAAVEAALFVVVVPSTASGRHPPA